MRGCLSQFHNFSFLSTHCMSKNYWWLYKPRHHLQCFLLPHPDWLAAQPVTKFSAPPTAATTTPPLDHCTSSPPNCSLFSLPLVLLFRSICYSSSEVILVNHKSSQIAHFKPFIGFLPLSTGLLETPWHTRSYMVFYKFLQPRLLPSASVFTL